MTFALGGVPQSGAAPSSATGTLEHRKLTDAAQQFEGMLLEEMLKPMREHGFCDEENDDKQEGGSFGDTLSSFGAETVATAIAKAGGFGIAKRVVEQVEGAKASHGARVGANSMAGRFPK